MEVITLAEARDGLEKIIGEVCESHSAVVIAGPGERAAILMPLEDYEAMEETAHLLSSPANAADLTESLRRANLGLARERELID